jgi:hypothetical protein
MIGGEFLRRIEAAGHALACGQIVLEPSSTLREHGHLNHPPNLYSEDLW